MCIERRFVPLGNTFLSDEQEQALIDAFEETLHSEKEESLASTPSFSHSRSNGQKESAPMEHRVGSARRRSQSAPTSISNNHDEEACSSSMPILPDCGGSSGKASSSWDCLGTDNSTDAGSEPGTPLSTSAGHAEQAETPTSAWSLDLKSELLSTSPVVSASWPMSPPPLVGAPMEFGTQPAPYFCEHQVYHQQESSQITSLNTDAPEFVPWAQTTMDLTISGYMPAVTPVMNPVAPVMAPPVHNAGHSALPPTVPQPMHVANHCHQPQGSTAEISTTPTAGTRSRRRGSKRTAATVPQHSLLKLSDMLQDPAAKDMSPATAEQDPPSMITPLIIAGLAAGKSFSGAASPGMLATAADTAFTKEPVIAGSGALENSCKVEEKLSPAREMLRQRGHNLLVQCLQI